MAPEVGSGKGESLAVVHQELLKYLNLGNFEFVERNAVSHLTKFQGDQVVWTMLGQAYLAQGRHDLAIEAMQRAFKLSSLAVDAAFNLGSALAAGHRYEESLEMFQKSVECAPDFAPGYFCLGNTFQILGRRDDAKTSYRKALEIQPSFVECAFNLARLYESEEDYLSAIHSYRIVLKVRPGFVQAQFNLGNLLRATGQADDAVECFLSVLRLQPNHVNALCNLALIKQELGKGSLDCFQLYARAISIEPTNENLHFNLGNAYLDRGNSSDAEQCFRSAFSLNPRHVGALNNLSVSLLNQSRFKEAEECAQKVLHLDPVNLDGHINLAKILRELGRSDEAMVLTKQGLALTPNNALLHANMLCAMAYSPRFNQAQYCTQATASMEAVYPKDLCANAINSVPREGRKLRIGYVSGDFRRHAVAGFILPILAAHDRKKVEVFAFPTTKFEDEKTTRIKETVDYWVPIAGVDDEAACRLIRNLKIDVLIDLSGPTAHNRLGVFARRSAKVQAHYLGFIATTGLSAMDYWIGDSVLLPSSSQAYFSEKLWRLPRTWLCYSDGNFAPDIGWAPRDDGFVYIGSYNNLSKISLGTLELWSKILYLVPNTKLVLKNRQLSEAWNQKRILQILTSFGVNPERVVLIGDAHLTHWTDHMAQYDWLDIALDPVGGVGGGTTSCDALWMGVPLVTLAGDGVGRRMSASMLSAVGRSEWIVSGEQEYIQKVAELASNVEGRIETRWRQREVMRMSKLCDGPGLAKTLEDAYESMFDERTGTELRC